MCDVPMMGAITSPSLLLLTHPLDLALFTAAAVQTYLENRLSLKFNSQTVFHKRSR